MAVIILVTALAVLALCAAIDAILSIYNARKKTYEREVNLNIHTNKPQFTHNCYHIIMRWYNTGSEFSKVAVANNAMEAVNMVTDDDMNKTYYIVKIEKV